MISQLDHAITFTITVAGYASFVVFGLVFWLVTRRKGSSIAGVGPMIQRIMHHRTTRVAIMIAWWWVGFHFLVNVVHR